MSKQMQLRWTGESIDDKNECLAVSGIRWIVVLYILVYNPDPLKYKRDTGHP